MTPFFFVNLALCCLVYIVPDDTTLKISVLYVVSGVKYSDNAIIILEQKVRPTKSIASAFSSGNNYGIIGNIFNKNIACPIN